ncbi:proline-rich early nodulin [Colletotrichum tofieldiae]|nr:proline-rich early nodulin [Colletotrichum tofieldiae]
MAPASVDVEMGDYASSLSTADLSPPPSSGGSEREDIQQRAQQNSLGQPPASLENTNPDSQATGTELANMRRSARNTNKPKTVIVTSTSRPAKRKITTKVVKKAPKWTTEKLLTDPKSPLASADLRTILCQPAAWDILSKEERAEIIGLFPAGTRILDPGTDNARPDLDALRNDNNFRHDCATYADNIAMGKHDPDWLEQAWAARERRRAGDFDSYLKQKFEDEWSCELPEEFRPKRDGGEPAKAIAAVEEQGKAQCEARMVVKAEDDGGAEEARVSEEAPKKDVEMTNGDESKEAAEVKLQSPAPQTSVIKLGSPVPEESCVKLGSPIPEEREDMLQRDK